MDARIVYIGLNYGYVECVQCTCRSPEGQIDESIREWNRRQKRMICEAITGSRYGSYPSPKGKGKDYYEMHMSNGDVLCTDTDPDHLTGDWAIVRTYQVAVRGG